jgi:hypothetical protein
MKPTSLLLAAVASSALTGSVARDARGLGPIDVEIGAKVGGGTSPSNPSSSINPLGFGLGGRGGVSFFGFYAGVDGMYYLGGNHAGLSALPSESVTFSQHTLMYGVDLGYGFKIASLTIRPQLGIGNLTVSYRSSFSNTCTAPGPCPLASGSTSSSTSSSYLYLEPGVTGLVSFGALFVGADANLLALPSVDNGAGGHTTGTAFTMHGQVGVRF